MFFCITFFPLSNKAKSIKLFSNKVIKGTITKKWEKYKTVEICPNSIKGDSTCFAPNCIKIKKLAINTKKAILLKKKGNVAIGKARYLLNIVFNT